MKNKTYTGGFHRSEDEGKLRFDLIPTSMLKRLAKHYTAGAKRYGEGNWIKAQDKEAIKRFKQSAWRHFIAWQDGDKSEDHASACVWNIFAYEHLNKNE